VPAGEDGECLRVEMHVVDDRAVDVENDGAWREWKRHT